MQREIKFRAWNKTTKEMENRGILHYWLCNVDPSTGKLVNVGIEEEGFEIMQYTGLTDKNGKEIWEGDILRCENRKNVFVTFEDGCFITKYSDKKDYTYENDNTVDNGLLCNYGGIFSECIEIVGNKWEDPELGGVK